MISLLLLDNEPPFGSGIRSALEGLPGCRVVAYESVISGALTGIRERRPDVVVIDAGTGAVEAARLIRRDASYARVLVLLPELTAKQLMLALEAGVCGIVANDADSSVLAAAIRAVDAGANYLSKEAAEALVRDYLRRAGHNSRKAQFQRLSHREREVLKGLASGQSMVGIADALDLSLKTVETYRRRAMTKLEVTTLPALVKVTLANEAPSL